MIFSKSFFYTALLSGFLFFSGCTKQDKQEYVDDKPISNSDTGKNQQLPKPDFKKDTSVPKLPGTNIPMDKQQQKTFERTFNPVAIISPLEANEYLGKEVTVNGLVAEVHRTDKVAYLNFVQKFPKTPFAAVIFENRFSSFPNLDKYSGKTVEVTGRVSSYKDKPQIILDNDSQIKIVK
jgi:hypothetical protein